MRSASPDLVTTDPPARRFGDVFAYIDAHLDDDLSLDRLARVARSSTFHFHHQFSARFGLTVHGYVTLARLRRAAWQLLFRPRLRVVDVALASGYASPEAFARAFRRLVGHTPTALRARPDWAAWNALNQRLLDVRARATDVSTEPLVQIELVPAVRVAALELRGQPLRLADALRRFIAWRIENRLPPARSATYSVFHDPAEPTAIDLCAATTRPVAPNALGVVEKWLPPGRCAVQRHVGTHLSLFEAARSLHARWLPASGYAPRAAPLVIRRISLFPDVAEHEAESEIFLPLA